jgi:hypothetical protein
MAEQSERVARLLFPGILLVFLGLYTMSLMAGVEAEIGLLRAGLAGVGLAIIGRIALGILEAATKKPIDAAEEQSSRLMLDQLGLSALDLEARTRGAGHATAAKE